VRAETDPAKYSAWVYEFARRRFNSNNFATSADMTEECALLNAILVNIVIAVPKKKPVPTELPRGESSKEDTEASLSEHCVSVTMQSHLVLPSLFRLSVTTMWPCASGRPWLPADTSGGPCCTLQRLL